MCVIGERTNVDPETAVEAGVGCAASSAASLPRASTPVDVVPDAMFVAACRSIDAGQTNTLRLGLAVSTRAKERRMVHWAAVMSPCRTPSPPALGAAPQARGEREKTKRRLGWKDEAPGHEYHACAFSISSRMSDPPCRKRS